MLLNLVIYCAHASLDGSPVTVRARCEEPRKRHPERHMHVLVLQVATRGRATSEEERASVFNPYSDAVNHDDWLHQARAVAVRHARRALLTAARVVAARRRAVPDGSDCTSPSAWRKVRLLVCVVVPRVSMPAWR
jgi:hypothetical protein